jgi:hypothetical protein
LIPGRSVWPQPPVVIIQPDDVVLTEVVAVLNLHKHQRDTTGVVNTVCSTPGNIDGIASPHLKAGAVKCDDPVPRNHEPVLGTT